jgi:MoxR-like ATPase
VVEVARGAGAKAEELIVDPSALKPDSPTPRQPTLVTVITPDIVKTVLSERALYLPDGLVLTALAALRANKHVLLTGPPGTGKTTFAEVLGESARRAGVAAGWFLTTATADWTSVDTVGGYRLTKDGDLSFWPGQVLQAIDAESWLVIDEFNRADIDKCFGQLFTVLSGQAVTLPFVDSEGDGEEMVSIVPEGAGPPSDTVPHYVDAEWRLLCTLNSRDRDFLFKLSYALLRRFAVIEIPIPDDAAYDAILSAKGATGSAELDKSLRELARLPARRLGPAILLDCAGYLRERRTLGGTAEDEWLWICEAIDEFVLPQLDDLTAAERRAVVGHLTSRVVGSNRAAEVARLVGNRLGVTPAELLPRDELASEALDEQ